MRGQSVSSSSWGRGTDVVGSSSKWIHSGSRSTNERHHVQRRAERRPLIGRHGSVTARNVGNREQRLLFTRAGIHNKRFDDTKGEDLVPGLTWMVWLGSPDTGPPTSLQYRSRSDLPASSSPQVALAVIFVPSARLKYGGWRLKPFSPELWSRWAAHQPPAEQQQRPQQQRGAARHHPHLRHGSGRTRGTRGTRGTREDKGGQGRKSGARAESFTSRGDTHQEPGERTATRRDKERGRGGKLVPERSASKEKDLGLFPELEDLRGVTES
ncbi:unnamed protein product [Pleuronectes platessa]|uniref:Uncharacterized protein n=1 Tax=Pleuronectes platessa TaxID=8262 RepID=A0A9N7YTQ5_PLEPL|nr:unnamed protein product [Pleuronectes platessa]